MPLLTPTERVGTTLAGKYRIERVIGRGGMGVVFAGTHLWTERPVAVKLLHAQYSGDPPIRRRFLLEARAAARLDHENVVDVLDMGEETAGDEEAVYLVLEMLEGHPLDVFVGGGRALTPEQTLGVLFPVLDALTAAHRAGIVHRDLKPENIFLHRKDGRVIPKVVDFGIAKLADAASTLTKTGAMMGTPQYMAPEQAGAAEKAGPAVDVWSMGVVLFQALSGRLPYPHENTMALIMALATEPVPRLTELRPSIPGPLAAVVDRALQKNPEDRYLDMGELLAALRQSAEQLGLDPAQNLRSFWPGALDSADRGVLPQGDEVVPDAATITPEELAPSSTPRWEEARAALDRGSERGARAAGGGKSASANADATEAEAPLTVRTRASRGPALTAVAALALALGLGALWLSDSSSPPPRPAAPPPETAATPAPPGTATVANAPVQAPSTPDSSGAPPPAAQEPTEADPEPIEEPSPPPETRRARGRRLRAAEVTEPPREREPEATSEPDRPTEQRGANDALILR